MESLLSTLHANGNQTGSPGQESSGWEVGNPQHSPWTLSNDQNSYYRDLIKKANSVSLIALFGVYGVKMIPGSKLITCPFKFHKGGRERTPSFEFYQDSNTFWCHGCSNGVRPVDFVAKMDGLSKTSAAHKILSLFDASPYASSDFIDPEDAAETLELMLSFSSLVRNFREVHPGEKAFEFIENICQMFDHLYSKHKLGNEGLKSAIEKFKVVVENWKGE